MSLLIPVAADSSSRLVHAHAAKKGAEYRCPACGDIVVWRRCDDVKRRSHFAHAPSSSCSGESATHVSAKIMAAQIIREWQRGEAPRPMLSLSCVNSLPGCERVWLPLQATTTAPPLLEKMLDCGYIPDVFASPLAVEILYRHPIPDAKVDGYNAAAVPWLEVQAEPLLEDPPRWRVVRATGHRVCGVCCSRLQVDAARIEKERQQAAASTRALGGVLAERRKDLGAIEESVKRAQSMAAERIAEAQRSTASAAEAAADAIARAMSSADRDKMRLLRKAEADVERLRVTELRLAEVTNELGPLEARYARLRAMEEAAALAVDAIGVPLRLGQQVRLVVEEQRRWLVVEEGILWAVSPDGWAMWTDKTKRSHITRLSNIHASPMQTGFEALT